MCSEKVAEFVTNEADHKRRRWYDPRQWEPTGWLVFVSLVICAVSGTRFVYFGQWDKFEKCRQELLAVINEPNSLRRFQKAFATEAQLHDCLGTRSRIDSAARLWLGVNLAFQERSDEINDLWKAADWSCCQTEDLAQAAMAFFRMSDFTRASDLIRLALQRPDARELVLRTATVIDFDLGRLEDVLASCQELSQLVPRDPKPWLITAAVYEARGDWPKVVEAYRTVLKLTDRDNARYRLVMIGFLLKVGNVTEAREIFERLRRESPGVLAEELGLEAKLLFSEGKFQEAHDRLESVVKKSPENPDDLLLWGRVLLQIGQPDAAIAPLAKAHRLRRTDSQILYQLAQAHRRVGHADTAIRLLEQHRFLAVVEEKIWALSRTAEADPNNLAVRQDLIHLCESIDAQEQVAYWRRSISAQATHEVPTK